MVMPPGIGRQEAEAVVRNVPQERYDRVVRLSQAVFGAPIAALTSGTSATIAVTVRAPETVTDAVVGAGIDSQLGVTIWGTNTKLLGQRLAPLRGRVRVEFSLRDIHLGEGRYSLHGAIARADGVELDRMRDASSLDVVNDGRAVGFTWFPVGDAVVMPVSG
jgi:ABC-2 type transport system ATP-binding protein